MANCNCNDFPISCAPHAPGGDCCHPHGCPPRPHPCPPPPFKGGTSMYIGARYVPIFADPVEWDDEREYEPLTIVTHNGDCYTSKCYVPKGAQLPPYPEGQTKYWVKTSDYNGQFADLKKTVLDLSRLVEKFQKDNKDFTDLINNWNEKVQQWETQMTAWGERLDTVESHVTDLTASLNAEIDRAKAAEQANAAAITKETTDRQQAISELDAAYKAADAAEAQARADADTALSDRITANKTSIDALKAEQAIQNTNISKNAKNISDNAAEIAKHAARLTDLESNASDWDSVFPNTTIAQEVQKEELARANADTALNGRCDTIAADVEEVRDNANHKVDQTAFDAAEAMNVKFFSGTKKSISTDSIIQTGNANRNSIVLGNSTGEISPATFINLTNFAYKTEVDAAQAAADKTNSIIGDWETDHPNQTISQCATSLENKTAANAAVIGDWNAEHPGKTIAQEVTRLSGAIPDVSGFVTKTTYEQEQAAQDAKITAAQTAANKANTSIGDWETEHPGKTIAQIDVRTYLDELFPANTVLPGFTNVPTEAITRHYGDYDITSFDLPIIVPEIYALFPTAWEVNITPLNSIIFIDPITGKTEINATVDSIELQRFGLGYHIHVTFNTPFRLSREGAFYLQLLSSDIFSCSWKKNAIKFETLPLPNPA